MLRLLLLLILFINTSCRERDTSDLSAIDKRDSSFNGRQSYQIYAQVKDDIEVVELSKSSILLKLRTTDSGVKVVDTSGYDKGLTFMNFLRNQTNNFGQGLTSKLVKIKEEHAEIKLVLPFQIQDLQPKEYLSYYMFCKKLIENKDTSTTELILLEYRALKENSKLHKAPKDTQALCQ